MLFNAASWASAVLALAIGALAVDRTVDPSLDASLKTAATNLDKLGLLVSKNGNDSWLFDFTKSSYYTFAPGGVANANAATFPAAVGTGMTMAILNLGPCSMLPPHLHPRATNFVVAVHGTTKTFMFNENGAETVVETLTPGKMTIFPQGSMHMVSRRGVSKGGEEADSDYKMQNTGCSNAQLVSALNSEDSGTLNMANGLWMLPAEQLSAVFGSTFDMSKLAGGVQAVGTGAQYGSEACMKRCNLTRPYSRPPTFDD